MRKLMWAVLGFAAGCGFCVYISPDSILPGLIAFALGGILCALFRGQRNVCLLVMLGSLAGVGWYGIFAQSRLAPLLAFDGSGCHHPGDGLQLGFRLRNRLRWGDYPGRKKLCPSVLLQ